jgi:serine/threonine protein kinase
MSEKLRRDRGKLPYGLLNQIDQICDRFEGAWEEASRPRIEDYLPDPDEPHRVVCLRELLALEIDARLRRGERPEQAEYRNRFPDHPEAIAAAFAVTRIRPVATPAGEAVRVDAGPDLLFGLLALQNGLVAPDQLVAAFRAWTRDKARPLAEHLTERGALDAEDRLAVEALVARHLKKHGGSAEQSLAALAPGRSTQESLAQLGDPDLAGTLSHVGSATIIADADPDRTASYAVGAATSDGQRFRVLRPHARGGLGAVFVALDTELHREVALKQILDQHADDPTSRHRFLLEAEVTGGLEHPGIVPVYGLGTYGDGRPYYAMRFIKGDSLKEAIERFHADEGLKIDPGRRSLELRKLLRRFTDVCNAIEYAHSRGVLHRDLKPGNVIVGKHGETLVVDWGLAKATGRVEAGSDSGERMLVPSSASGSAATLPGLALGTPSYMSPEQAEGRLDRLGPRSDVYSLGAMLYCLLTGRPPFEGEVAEVIRAVQRGEFRPPRAIEPTIDQALEAVCLKAMALHPEDRYSTCRALAEDVERWLADEPVSAWREPLPRRARRWGRRNRTAVSGAAAVLAGLIGLAAVAVEQSRSKSAPEAKNLQLTAANTETTKAKDEAEGALAETTKAKQATDAALAQSEESRRQAEESQKQAEAVSDFLVEAFRSPDPSQTGREVKVADVLDRATEKLDKEFTGSQATKGKLLETLGTTYRGLGLYDRSMTILTKARGVLEAAVGPDHPDMLRTRDSLAVAYGKSGRLPEAIALEETTLKLMENKLGPDHPNTLVSRSNLAMAYQEAGRTEKAIALLDETMKLMMTRLGPDHPDTLVCRNNLAIAYGAAGRMDESIALDEENLKLRIAKLGHDHPHTLASRTNLALAYWTAGRTSEAITLLEETMKLMTSRLGPDHPDTLVYRNNLSLSYLAAGRTSEAIALEEETLRLWTAKLGPDDSHTLLSRNNLASAYHTAGQFAKSEPILRECLTIREKTQPDEMLTFYTRGQLGGSLLGQKKYAEAEPLILAGYEGLKAREARIAVPKRSILRRAAERVIQLYESWDKPEQAAAWKAKLGMSDLPTEVFTTP